jgi:uncharacterized protein YlzI (FlbEa/FlbD family)
MLMNFVILYKAEESSNLKEMNFHHEQIVYDFNSYIESNLVMVYDFITNSHHPFIDLAINDTLSYILTLLIQVIRKFRVVALNDLL